MWSLIAQAADPSNGWLQIVATYGIASPFVLLCLYIMKEQRAEIKELREYSRKLSDAAMDRVLPTTLEATGVMKETAEALTASNVMIHAISGRPNMDPVLLARLVKALEDVERGQRHGSN